MVLDPAGHTVVSNRDQLSKPGYTVFDGLTVPFRLDRVLLRGVEVVPGGQPRGEVLAGLVKDAWIDREARKGKGPSDHAPVIVDLSL